MQTKQPDARQDFLVFRLADREFGVALDSVQELTSFDQVVAHEGAEPFTGILQLRSLGIPVLDPYRRMSDSTDNSRLSDVVIFNDGKRVTGLAVDCVLDVVSLAPHQILPTAASGSMTAVGAAAHRKIGLLDIELLLNGEPPVPLGLAA